MPELPEVEAVKRGLDQSIVSKRVTAIEVMWSKIIRHDDIEAFKQSLIGQVCQRIDRRGKFLLIYFDTHVLLSHLRMEGKYFLCDKEQPVHKHTHVILELDKQEELRYHDVRKFGRMELLEIGQEFQHPSLAKLGPEPTPATFSPHVIKEYLSGRTTAIKNILLDQRMVAGIGNIYADEILFDAYIHPEMSAAEITDEEIQQLYYSIISIMQAAIKAGGSTIRSYANMFGEAGHYQAYHQVYGKDGESCSRCGTIIEKTKVGGRGTHFCPNCQRKRGT